MPPALAVSALPSKADLSWEPATPGELSATHTLVTSKPALSRGGNVCGNRRSVNMRKDVLNVR
jgi:hypothetical protein